MAKRRGTTMTIRFSERDGRAAAKAILDHSVSARDKRTKIVCLSGSTRFIDVMAVEAWNLEKTGVIALACHLLPRWYTQVEHHLAEAQNVAHVLDELHLRKIDIADELRVINVGGYIGEATRREIEYAKAHQKPVSYLELLV